MADKLSAVEVLAIFTYTGQVQRIPRGVSGEVKELSVIQQAWARKNGAKRAKKMALARRTKQNFPTLPSFLGMNSSGEKP